MARIHIEPAKAKRSVLDEQSLEKKLSNLSQEVSSIRSNMRYKISGREQISDRLRQVAQQISKEATSTRALSNGLQQVITKYEQTENAARDRAKADKTSVQKVGATGANLDTSGANSGADFDWGKFGKKTLKSLLGPFGLITGIPDLIEGKPGDLFKYVLDGAGGMAKVAGASGNTTTAWLKSVFGLKPMEYESFGKTFTEKFVGDGTAAKTFGAVVNWATNAVDSFVKNTEEFGGKWCARFWEETAAETVIKVAEGAAVTAGVSAATAGICAAVGVACPPALVVGVVAAGATVLLDWGLDKLVSWATNGSCTSWVEGVSDLVCNGIDKIREGAGKVVAKTGEIVNNVKNAVVDTGKKIGETIVKGAQGFAEGVGNLFSGRWVGCLFG